MLDRALVDEINARHGTSFRAVGRYPGGEQGALRLLDASGRPFVLKGPTLSRADAVVAMTASLAKLGYPAPRYVIVADDYTVHEELPGTPLRTFTPLDAPVADRLLELNELQGGRAVVEPRDWPRFIVDTALVGEETYMVLDTLRRHSSASRRLLALCHDAVRRYAGDTVATDDVVHADSIPQTS